MMTGTRYVRLAALGAACFTGLMASNTEAADSDSQLQEITVTAQRKEENLQKAAISLTALSGDDLAATGIRDPQDMQARLPGVQFQDSGLPSIMIRGVGTFNNQPGVDSAVLYSVDGTYLSHIHALPPTLFDIGRIEVVRGPQGTLYGRNSNGGSLNIITNRPVLNEYQGSLGVNLGNFDTVSGEAFANLPLGEKAAVRIAFANDKADPYFDDGSQKRDNWGTRIRLAYEPTDNLSFLATAEYSEQDAGNIGNAYCPPTSALPACEGVPWRPYGGFGAPGSFVDGVGGSGINPGYQTRKNYGAYAQLDWTTDIGTLTSVSSWHKFDERNSFVWDHIDYQPSNIDTFFTQEVRFASPAGSTVSWVGGLFYADEGIDALESYDYSGVPGIRTRIIDGKMESRAVFGEVTVPLTEALRATAGGRYTDERKDMPGSSTVYDATGTIPSTVLTGQVPATERKFTWKAGLDYDLSDTHLLYAKVSTGFKSGGVNPVPQGLGLPETYAPETIKAYQFGSKNRFRDDHIQVNAEAFYYDYEGYQTVIQTSAPTVFPGGFFTTANSQKARFRGGEVETVFRVLDRGTLSLAGTYLDAKFVEFVVGTTNMSGKEPQAAPRFTFSGAYDYLYTLASGAELRGQINSQWVADNYTRPNNAPASLQRQYTLTGLNGSYTTPDGVWTFSLFVRNLENDHVMRIYLPPNSRPGDGAFMMPPRLYGVGVRWNGGT